MSPMQRVFTVKDVFIYKNEKKFAQFGPLKDVETAAILKQIEAELGEGVELVSHTKATPFELSHSDDPEETIIYTDGRSTYQINICKAQFNIH